MGPSLLFLLFTSARGVLAGTICWVAVEELRFSYHIGAITIYTHYGNLIHFFGGKGGRGGGRSLCRYIGPVLRGKIAASNP